MKRHIESEEETLKTIPTTLPRRPQTPKALSPSHQPPMNHCTFSLLPPALPQTINSTPTTTVLRLARHIVLKRVLQHPLTKLQAYMSDLSKQDVPGDSPRGNIR